MSISYRVDSIQKVVFTTITGEVTDEQILRHLRAFGSDTEIDPSFAELVYADPTSVAGVTNAGIRDLAYAFRASGPVRKTAFVTTHDVAFGLARMYESIADESPVEIRVFRDLAEAKSWLGIE